MSGKTVNKVSEISPSIGIPASQEENIIDQDILNQIRAISRQERTNTESQNQTMTKNSVNNIDKQK